MGNDVLIRDSAGFLGKIQSELPPLDLIARGHRGIKWSRTVTGLLQDCFRTVSGLLSEVLVRYGFKMKGVKKGCQNKEVHVQ